MDRTGFLRTLGAAVAGSALLKTPLLGSSAVRPGLPIAPPITPTAKALTFQWRKDRILASKDGGLTWKQHARFGQGFEVMSVYAKDDQVIADVLFKRAHRFQLRLDETGTAWRSELD